MAPSLPKSAKDNDQHARFLETARALGCDEDEAEFDEKLKAVVGPKRTVSSAVNDLASAEAELARLLRESSEDDNVRTSRDTAIRHARNRVEAIKNQAKKVSE